MCTQLQIKEKNQQLYVPEPAEIIEIKQFTDMEKFFKLRLVSGRNLNHQPGQFVQISVLGIGEAPISISSPPNTKDASFELCIRAVGEVTKRLHSLNIGDKIFVRGPFGHGFDDSILQKIKGKHLLFISGGIGYVPLRSLINKVLAEKDQYQKITILNGCKTPKDRMYIEELAEIAKMGGNVELLETVDKADAGWSQNEGVITTLIPKVTMEPANVIAVIVGPPVMYKFVLMSLKEKNIPNENIYMSLERRMKCGVGKCGHCQMEGVYVCQEGPVFCYADVQDNEEAL